MLAEVPCPAARPGHLLIQSSASLVSIGTERMLIDFGKAGWLEKARQQPDKVKMVLQKIRTDGIFPTLDSVRAKLDKPVALGYANVGTARESRIERWESSAINVGDRVVSNGPHAEMVCVPKNLCAKVPDSVPDEEAAFTVIGAIGLQGVRLLQPTLGETVVVTGLGLIGLIAVQLLRANGCRVLGIDFDSTKCSLAREFGAESVDLSKGEDPVIAAARFSDSRGIDAVLITASTKSNEPVHQAALMCRKRGRIVLVGVTGLELSRADFYEKELSFQVSCSYGPGRYDENYEVNGHDYPLGHVRWTEQRNFEAILDLMAARRVDVRPLISHAIPFENALEAYAMVGEGKALGILLKYAESPANSPPALSTQRIQLHAPSPAKVPEVVIGVVGAGNFTGQVLLPALKRTGARLKTIVSSAGVTSTHLGNKFGFEQSTTDADAVFGDAQVNTVLITSRHSSHARYVIRALKAGKRIFVEKPLCVKPEELDEIISAYRNAPSPFLMVGFNRRFAPQIAKIKALLASVHDPKNFILIINAGTLPANHWTQSGEEGGRIIGEGCHFVDLLRFLCGYPIQAANAVPARRSTSNKESLTFSLEFSDGSTGTVHYLTNGHRSFPKERLEVFCAGRILQLDNFRKLTAYGWPKLSKMKLWRQDKGYQAEMCALVEAIASGKPSPIPFDEICDVTQAVFKIAEPFRSPAPDSEMSK